MYEVDIIEIIVFIQNGKIGNKIRIKVTEVADRFAKATIEV
jgi:predicted RNA-binding protein with TRAM domain